MTDNTARRRGHGEDAIYFDAAKNRYVGAISVGFGPGGKRIRCKVTGRTKAEVRDKLKAAHNELDRGLHTSATYTAAARPVPPSVAVWHSVRQGGDTKTAKSRRTLALPQAAVQALREHRKRRRRTGWRRGPCGRITGWSSPRPSAPRWTRPTSAASSARSPKRLASVSAGRRGTCATPSSP